MNMTTKAELLSRIHDVFVTNSKNSYALLDQTAVLSGVFLKASPGFECPEPGSIIETAGIAIFGTPNPVVRLVLLTNDAGCELTITVELDDDWKLQHAFPGIAETFFGEKAFANTLTITSRVLGQEDEKGEPFRAYLHVRGDSDASFVETLTIFPHSRLFELESTPVTLTIPDVPNLSVRKFRTKLQLQEPQNILGGLAKGALHLWGIEFPFKIDWPPATTWVLESDFDAEDGIPLGDPSDFSALVKAAAGENADIPEIFEHLSKEITAFKITDLLLKFDSSTNTVISVAITIGTTQSWTLIDPIKFSSPSIRLTINEPFSSSREFGWHVEGTVGLGQRTHFHLEADHGGEGYQFYGELSPGDEIDIGEMFGQVGIKIPNFHPQVYWLNFRFSSQKEYHFEIGIHDLFESDIFKFENLFLSFGYASKKLSDCNLNSLVEVGGVGISVSAEHSDGGWEFSGSGENIPMGRLIEQVAAEVDGRITLPDELKDFHIDNLSVQFHSKTKYFRFSCKGRLTLEHTETLAEITVTRSIDKDKKSTIKFGGHLTVAERRFNLSCHKEAGASRMVASYQKDGGDRIELRKLIGGDLGEQIPESLAITIDDIYLAYCNEEGDASAGDPAILTSSEPAIEEKEKATAAFSGFLLGADLGASIQLSDIPLAGASLPAGFDAGVDKLRVVLASKAFQAKHLKGINEDLGEVNIEPLELPEKSGESKPEGKADETVVVGKGLSLSAELKLGELKRAISLTTAKSKSKSKSAASGEGDSGTMAPKVAHDRAAPAPRVAPDVSVATEDDGDDRTGDGAIVEKPSGGATWITLDKKLGPVDFQRIGLQYQNSALWVLLDVALSSSGLTLSLDGLGVGSPLSEFKPKFKLDGIGIDYRGTGGVEIGGAFLREKVPSTDIDQYSGAALIKTEALKLSAMGSYAEMDGYSSMFVYAFLDKPLGGPAFFFVTGLAAGFGYNRALKSPTEVDEIESFPLVSIAMGNHPVAGDDTSTLMDILSSLGSYVPPAANKVFLALGVKFNSFKLIDSFALLVATFGDEFRLKLLGLSKIVAPPTESGKTPVAEVTIGLIAEFIPDDGLLKIDGKIMPGSYVLDRDCQLTGGFAFYSWFTGPHEGDFVLTVGGYHPNFRVPAHYPSIERLALNWQIDSDLSVKGTTYFALTSGAVMAGGELEARLDRGDLQAWFDLKADFLVCWQPFHYDIALSIGIGASYETFLCTFRASLSAAVHLWGPEFAGTAHVHFIFVSFTVPFGATGIQKPPPLSWEQFKTSFLPKDEDVCTIAVKDGLARSKKEATAPGGERWIINPKDFALTIDSVIPMKKVEFLDKKPSGLTVVHADGRLGIGSMELSDFQSTLTVTVTRFDAKTNKKDDWFDKFRFAPVRKRVPSALWGKKPEADLNGKPIRDVLCGFEIRPAGHPKPGDTNDIKCSVLRYNIEDREPGPQEQALLEVTWLKPAVPKVTGRWSVEAKPEKGMEKARRKMENAFFPDEADSFDPLEVEQFNHLLGEFLELPQLTSN